MFYARVGISWIVANWRERYRRIVDDKQDCATILRVHGGEFRDARILCLGSWSLSFWSLSLYSLAANMPTGCGRHSADFETRTFTGYCAGFTALLFFAREPAVHRTGVS